ncbi:hypothetical protein ACF0H5_017466 [Mactra antiquata]
MELLLLLCLVSSTGVTMVMGHARLIDPPGRSTMWRYGFHTPRNTDDHQLSCGGFGVQFYQNGGKCGVCGDRYDGARDNEAGGKYANGIIVHTYKMGEILRARVEITVNHGGWFEFKVCPTNNPGKRATQDCFDKYLLRQTNGATRYQVRPGLGPVTIELMLPSGLTCTQCVLQWRWNTASNVACDGSNCCRGCGPQEQFYGCADITITGDKNNNSPYVHQAVVLPTNKPTFRPTFRATFRPTNRPTYKPTARPTYRPAPVNPNPVLPVNSGFPDSFIPVGQILQNPNPVVPQAPACTAKPFWRVMFPLSSQADKWCKDTCLNGLCPLDRCSQSCWSVK